MKAVNLNEKTSHLNDMRVSTYLTVVWDFSVLSYISAWKPPKSKFIYDLVTSDMIKRRRKGLKVSLLLSTLTQSGDLSDDLTLSESLRNSDWPS